MNYFISPNLKPLKIKAILDLYKIDDEFKFLKIMLKTLINNPEK